MTQDIDTTKGNGSKVYDPKAYAPGSVLRPGQQGSEAKVILETGKEERALYFKADFLNDDEVKATLLAIREAEKHHVDWLVELNKDLVAGETSIKGRRTNLFATILTGVWGNDNRLNKLFKDNKREQEKVRE